jgi:hypothetical protein
VKLHTVNGKQSMNKFMDWERHNMEEKLQKHYPVTLLRAGYSLLIGHHQHCGCGEESGGTKLVEVALGEGLRHPSGGLLLLHHSSTAAGCAPSLWFAHGNGNGAR